MKDSSNRIDALNQQGAKQGGKCSPAFPTDHFISVSLPEGTDHSGRVFLSQLIFSESIPTDSVRGLSLI